MGLQYSALQLKAQKIIFVSLCLRLGKVAAVVALFLCPACCLEKEMVHHFQSLLMICIKGM